MPVDVLLCEPHAYLTNHLTGQGHDTEQVVEAGKLFVSPAHRRKAIGKALLQTAFADAHARKRTVAFAAVVTSREAYRMYESVGMQEVGGFVGVHGRNQVLIDASGRTSR